MTEDRTETARSLYDAFAAGDMDTLGQLLGETDWHEAEGMPYGGRYTGFAEIAANVFGPIGNDVADFSAIPDEIVTVGGTRVAAFGHYRGTGAKGALDVPFAHIWTVTDGRMERFVQFADTHLFRQATGL